MAAYQQACTKCAEQRTFGVACHCCQAAPGCGVGDDALAESVPQAALAICAALCARQTVDTRNSTQSDSRARVSNSRRIADAPVDSSKLVQHLLVRQSRLLKTFRHTLGFRASFDKRELFLRKRNTGRGPGGA